MKENLIDLYHTGIFDATVCELFGIEPDFITSYADAMTFRTNEPIMTARRTRSAFFCFLLECETLRDVDGNTVYRNDDSEMIRELARIAPRCPSADYICNRLSEVVR